MILVSDARRGQAHRVAGARGARLHLRVARADGARSRLLEARAPRAATRPLRCSIVGTRTQSVVEPLTLTFTFTLNGALFVGIEVDVGVHCAQEYSAYVLRILHGDKKTSSIVPTCTLFYIRPYILSVVRVGSVEEHERLVAELCAALELTMGQTDADAEPSAEIASTLGTRKMGTYEYEYLYEYAQRSVQLAAPLVYAGSGSRKPEGALQRFLPPHAYTHLSGGFVVEDERHPYPVEETHRPRVRDVLLEGAWPEWLRSDETLDTSAAAPASQPESDAELKSRRRDEAAAAASSQAGGERIQSTLLMCSVLALYFRLQVH